MKSRSKVGRALSMIALCCSIVYLLLRIFGMLDSHLHFKGQTAFAVDTVTLPTVTGSVIVPDVEYRRLSLEETIGLYGYRMQVTYTGLDLIDKYLQLELMGSADTPSGWPTLSSARQLTKDPNIPNGSSWDDNINVLWWYPSDPAAALQNTVKESEYLIYGCYFPIGFESHSSIAHPNIRVTVDFPEGITVNDFENVILFTRNPSAVDSGWSYIQHYGSKTFPINQMSASLDGSGKGQSLVTPFPENIDNETGLTMGIIPNSVFDSQSMSGTPFTLSQEVWTFNGCAITDGNYTNLPTGGWFIVYVQRPWIISSIEWPTPPPTTRPPETTRPDFTTPLYTYDLSPLETNQINQIRLQNEQLQVEYAQLQGINYICNRLDAIYRQMVANGEIPVNLIPGSPVELYNSDVRNEINGILTSYTTSQLPDYEYEMDFVHRAFVFLWAEPWIAALGGLSLCCSVAAWIIFEGRRG